MERLYHLTTFTHFAHPSSPTLATTDLFSVLSSLCFSNLIFNQTVKLQYFGHLMQRVDSFEKTLMLGKIEGRRRGDDRGWDGWMASLTQWTWVWVDSRIWWWTGRPGVLWFMGSQRPGHYWVTELNVN